MTTTKKPLVKHTFHLEKGQFERLARLHPNIKGAEIIRTIINAYLDKHEARLAVPESMLAEASEVSL